MYFSETCKRTWTQWLFRHNLIPRCWSCDAVTWPDTTPGKSYFKYFKTYGDQLVCKRWNVSQQHNVIFLLSDSLLYQQWTKEYGRPHWLQRLVTLTECWWMWMDMCVRPISNRNMSGFLFFNFFFMPVNVSVCSSLNIILYLSPFLKKITMWMSRMFLMMRPKSLFLF